jgi:multiple sugar transport system permease protein
MHTSLRLSLPFGTGGRAAFEGGVIMTTLQTSGRKKKSRLIDDNLPGFLFSLPWLIGFLIFSLYPILMSAYYSFTDFSAIRDPEWVGLSNYKFLFHDPSFFKSLYNTFFFVIASVPATIILGLVTAMLLNLKIRGQPIFRSIFFIPSILPLVASTMVWIWILDPTNGYLNRFLRLFGVPTINWLGSPAYTRWSIVIMALWGVGTTTVIFLAAIQDVPNELYEAAEMDGAGRARKFFNITIPSISHIILYQIILALINAFQYFTQVYVILTAQSGNMMNSGSGGPQDSLLMYPLYLYYNAFTYLKMGRASAMAWILFIIVGLLTLLLTKTSKKWVDLQ